ncbi:MAG: hypothetical protein H6737_18630 [Alphaproteobacteria bacterium]|nr:hypothetical protein [Alphaproteobacteria bacterium]
MRSPPSGMDVTFTDRGFDMAVVGALPGGVMGLFRSLLPPLFLLEVIGGFVFLGAVIEGDVPAGPLCVLGAVCLAVTALGFTVWSRANTPMRGRFALEGDTLTFTSTTGEVRMSLADVKAVDVVPIGLAIRPKKGMTHHVMMLQTSDPARRWLDEAIEAARVRYGTSAEVPDELDALKKR